MFKRLFDFIVAFIGLICLSPLLLVISLLIKFTSPGPIFFTQDRVGKEFRVFRIYKFRTMTVETLNSGLQITVKGDPRVTSFGKVIRHLKLDELPQLYNILKGEMSLVGPRPEVPGYVDMFKEDYKVILQVLPGITDSASVEFRDESALLSDCSDPQKAYLESILPRKIQLAKNYVLTHTFYCDLKIIAQTFGVVLFSASSASCMSDDKKN